MFPQPVEQGTRLILAAEASDKTLLASLATCRLSE